MNGAFLELSQNVKFAINDYFSANRASLPGGSNRNWKTGSGHPVTLNISSRLRNADGNHRTVARRALNRHVAMVGFNVSFHQAKTQPESTL